MNLGHKLRALKVMNSSGWGVTLTTLGRELQDQDALSSFGLCVI